MLEISDEFKVIVVDAIRALCLKFPGKQAMMLQFLAASLRDEGGYDFKKAIVESIFDIVGVIPESKEAGAWSLSARNWGLRRCLRKLTKHVFSLFCNTQRSRICANLSKTASLLDLLFVFSIYWAKKVHELQHLEDTFATFTIEQSWKMPRSELQPSRRWPSLGSI
jgi:hypothetical protein